jgi:hypothetical protein
VRDGIQVQDIEGARSNRLYRGKARDVFKVQSIEGAHPHKARRSPRSYAFDDYKDVTSARKYRRPFGNSLNNTEDGYFNNKPVQEKKQIPRTNFDVPQNLYNKMDYYNLPLINDKNEEVTVPSKNIYKSSFNAFNTNAKSLASGKNLHAYDSRNTLPYNPGAITQRNMVQNSVTASNEYSKNLKKFFQMENGDTLDREMNRSKVGYSGSMNDRQYTNPFNRKSASMMK